MAKFCIFCGLPPTDKNKEHVVPLWLIKLTGDPNRKASFGYIMSDANRSDKQRQYAFDQFTFPACEACNSKYSNLETVAQVIIEKILESKSLYPREISSLLDWLDKVRIGLWLGFHQLDKNHLEIEPNFHIERRIGQYDRILIVEKTNYPKSRLNFGGVNTPSFGFTPSAFTLSINQYCFTNVSYSYLLSRRIGFPYPNHLKLQPDRPELACQIQPPRKRIMVPLLKRPIAESGNIFYQPMFAQALTSARLDEYNDPYVVEHSLDHQKGVGSIYADIEGSSPSWLKSDMAVDITPATVIDAYHQHIKSAINICHWQNWLSEDWLSLEDLPPNQKRYVREIQRIAKRVNDTVISQHKALLTSGQSVWKQS